LARGPGAISVLEESHRQVEAVVRVVRVGTGRLGEVFDRRRAPASPGLHNAQIVVNLGERQSGGQIVERGERLLETSAIELRHAQQKVGLAGDRIILGYAAEPGSGRFVFVGAVIRLAQLQHGQRVIRIELYRFPQVANLLLLAGGQDSADIALERIEADRPRGFQELIAGDRGRRSHLLQQLPRQRRLQIDQAGQGAAAVYLRVKVQLLHVEKLRIGLEGLALETVVAEHDVVGIHLFSDTVNRRPRGPNAQRNAGMIEGVAAIIAVDDVEPGRLHALRQDFGKSLSDPLQPWSGGLIFKRHDHHGAASGKRLGRAVVTKQAEHDQKKNDTEKK